MDMEAMLKQMQSQGGGAGGMPDFGDDGDDDGDMPSLEEADGDAPSSGKGKGKAVDDDDDAPPPLESKLTFAVHKARSYIAFIGA